MTPALLIVVNVKQYVSDISVVTRAHCIQCVVMFIWTMDANFITMLKIVKTNLNVTFPEYIIE